MSNRSLILKDDSIEVRFPFDYGVLEAVKRVPGRRFDGATKNWIFPLNAAAAMGALALASEHGFIVEEALAKQLTKLAKGATKDPVAIAAGGQPVLAPYKDGVAAYFSYGSGLLDIVKAIPGRKWEGEDKCWYIPPSAEAAQPVLGLLKDHGFLAMGDATDRVNAMMAQRQEVVDLSRAATANIELPVPMGLDYLPFQRAGIAYAAARPNALIADEPGLGKTIEFIGVCNTDESARSVLIVTTGSSRVNWKREFKKWDTKALSVGLATKEEFPTTDVVIIHYEMLKLYKDVIRQRQWDMLGVDEAHKMKNYKAQRSQMVLGSKEIAPIAARRKMFLTGTPILNRPEEMWPLLRALAPQVFRNRQDFLQRYCGAFHDGWGWKTGEATNLDELQEKLRASIMVRRLKSEVLKELPAKIREVVEIQGKSIVGKEQKALSKMQQELLDLRVEVELAKASANDAAYASAVDKLRQREEMAFKDMAKLRKATALAKLPYAIDHINDALENGKVVVFAHHAEIIERLKQEYGDGCVVIDGRTKMDERQELVDRFQNDPDCGLFVGQMEAAGEAITLTAASHEIFLELGHTPGGMTQCEDRCHRIGQRNSVLVQHLVLEGSIDAVMAKRLIEKQKTIDRALNNEAENSALDAAHDAIEDAKRSSERRLAAKEVDIPEVQTMGSAAEILAQAGPPSTAEVRRSELKKLAESFTPAHIAAIHGGLRQLANVCDGAAANDAQGFNGFDARMGHVLAEKASITAMEAALGRKMLVKYRRQLGDELMAAMGVDAPAEKKPKARKPKVNEAEVGV